MKDVESWQLSVEIFRNQAGYETAVYVFIDNNLKSISNNDTNTNM